MRYEWGFKCVYSSLQDVGQATIFWACRLLHATRCSRVTCLATSGKLSDAFWIISNYNFSYMHDELRAVLLCLGSQNCRWPFMGPNHQQGRSGRICSQLQGTGTEQYGLAAEMFNQIPTPLNDMAGWQCHLEQILDDKDSGNLHHSRLECH